MKTFYEVRGWDFSGTGGVAANTIEEAYALCDDAKCYIVAIDNGFERRQLNEDEEQQLSRARSKGKGQGIAGSSSQ
jgi:hypothetical protein